MAILDNFQIEQLLILRESMESLRNDPPTDALERRDEIIKQGENNGISDHLIECDEEHFEPLLRLFQQGDK